MPEITYIPAKGRVVPLQDGRDWPATERGKPIAAIVEDSLYYRRRVADGDLLVASDEAEAVSAEGPEVPGAAAPVIPETEPAAPGDARKKSSAGASGSTGDK